MAPKDNKNLVYLVFCWLGIGTLLPWNFFISVPGYWMTKWATPDLNATTTDNNNNNNNNATSGYNDLQTKWNSRLAVASMVPNVTFLLLNAIFGHRFRTQPRLLVSLCLVIALFAFTAAMTQVDTDPWQETFYYVTLLSVVAININGAIFQGGLLGLAGKFPPRYMGGVFSGQAIGGIFACTTNIIFLAIGQGNPDPVEAAFYSFIIAVVFLFSALIAFFFVTRCEFYQFYVGEVSSKSKQVPELEALSGGGDIPSVKVDQKVNQLSVLKTISLYAVSVFLVFAVTLACFPAITVLVESVELTHAKANGLGKEDVSLWASTYYVPVACFLLFNVGDYIGRLVAELTKRPKPGKVGMIVVTVVSVLRLAFIPLFLFCNVSPDDRNVTEVFFEYDAVFIVIMAVFSLSNGFLASVCMMCAPQLFKNPAEQQNAASLMAAILGLGLGVGSASSLGVVKLL